MCNEEYTDDQKQREVRVISTTGPVAAGLLSRGEPEARKKGGDALERAVELLQAVADGEYNGVAAYSTVALTTNASLSLAQVNQKLLPSHQHVG